MAKLKNVNAKNVMAENATLNDTVSAEDVNAGNLNVSGGGRSVYCHHIGITRGGYDAISFQIFTSTPQKFTYETLAKWLYDAGITDNKSNDIVNTNKRVPASGAGTIAYYTGISSGDGKTLNWFGGSSSASCYNYSSSEIRRFDDIVVQII